MVAQRDNIGTGGEEILRLIWGQPHAGDILTVDHGEVHAVDLLKGTQGTGQMAGAILAGNISQCQHTKFHRVSSR